MFIALNWRFIQSGVMKALVTSQCSSSAQPAKEGFVSHSWRSFLLTLALGYATISKKKIQRGAWDSANCKFFDGTSDYTLDSIGTKHL
jgi:hypothetical protein